MHFTLYNPPTQLFSSVFLSAEMLPTGGLTLSSLLESVTILCRDSAPLYHLLLPEASSLGPWPTHGTQELGFTQGWAPSSIQASCLIRSWIFAQAAIMKYRTLGDLNCEH